MQTMKTEPMRNRMGWSVASCGLRRLALGAGLLLAAVGGAPRAMANPFEAVLSVNDRVITQYELEQRQLFLQILQQQGDLPQLARNSLIEDRLRLFAAEAVGLTIAPDQVLAGMEEFAGRANLTTEEFLELTSEMGLASESFRDFVEAGMVWREMVRAKYGGGVTITEAEIDRAIREKFNIYFK